MTYTYYNQEKTLIQKDDGVVFPVVSKNESGSRYYLEFVASGETPSDYVAPPEPEPLTAQQKLEKSGLTVDELKTLLGI